MSVVRIIRENQSSLTLYTFDPSVIKSDMIVADLHKDVCFMMRRHVIEFESGNFDNIDEHENCLEQLRELASVNEFFNCLVILAH